MNSTLLNSGQPTDFEARYIFQNNDLFGSTKSTNEKQAMKQFPELEPLFEAASLAELELQNSISWYFGKTKNLNIITTYRYHNKLVTCKIGRKSRQTY